MTPSELRAIMARNKLRQVDAAERLRVSQATVSRWMRGSRPIRPAMAAHIKATLEEEK